MHARSRFSLAAATLAVALAATVVPAATAAESVNLDEAPVHGFY